MPTDKTLAGAALLGVAGGLRTFTAPAALAFRGRLAPGRWRYVVAAAAAGEYVGDKLPNIPARTSAPGFAGRVLSGAVSGRVLAGTPGAAIGAAGAGVGTVAGYRARKALGELTGLPDAAIGVAEDGIAIAAAALATRSASSAEEPEEEPRTRRLARGAARGAFAGVFGTAVMTGAQLALQRATGGEESRSPERVGRKIAARLFGTRVPRGQRDTLNQAMHWMYGTSWGVDVGLTAAARGQRPGVLAGGAALGLTAWVASLVELPALGVAPPPWRQPPARLAADAGLHLLFGASVVAALRALP